MTKNEKQEWTFHQCVIDRMPTLKNHELLGVQGIGEVLQGVVRKECTMSLFTDNVAKSNGLLQIAGQIWYSTNQNDFKKLGHNNSTVQFGFGLLQASTP